MEPSIILEPFAGPGWREMVALRDRLLRAPLGLAFDAEQLAAEAGQLHLALRLGPVLAGTLLLLPPSPDGEAKLRQMAIDPALQKRGLGTMLLRRGEAELRERGAARVRLAARDSAVGFYGRLGYVVDGAPFIEVTLPHRTMRKDLQPDP